nr:rod shape-determining protein MreC [uncultured Prevotella sp.]
MHNLLEFLAKYNHWLLFVVLEAVSFTLLFQYNSYQGSVWFSSANAVSGKLYDWNSDVESFFSLTKLNQELSQRNVYLEQQVQQLSERLTDVTKDSTWVQRNQISLLQNYRLIPAKVVSNSIDDPNNLITLDKGSADGIHKDMGVVCGTGVVGIVYLVSQHYSVVIPVLNVKSNISCKIQNRGYFGYLRWKGGVSEYAYLEEVPRHAHFKLGDNVVTSGYSAVFPPGVLVGKILHVFNSSDGLSYRVMLKVSTDFGKLRDVCVIDDTPMRERLEIMRAAQDSIKP